jgi:hypothetical protein
MDAAKKFEMKKLKSATKEGLDLEDDGEEKKGLEWCWNILRARPSRKRQLSRPLAAPPLVVSAAMMLLFCATACVVRLRCSL